MSGFLTTASTLMCPHGGMVIGTPSSTQVMAGAPVLTVADVFMVAGCAFVNGATPSPCVTVQWVSGAARVTAGGAAALTAASVGLCIAATGAPQGTALVAATQTAASGQ
jgi:hypothetical protein